MAIPAPGPAPGRPPVPLPLPAMSLIDINGVSLEVRRIEAAAGAGTLAKIDGIAVTDSVGHPLPCEDMVGQLKSIVEAKTLQPKQQTEAEGYLTKALERCNADDDAWADAFSAHGISLASK